MTVAESLAAGVPVISTRRRAMGRSGTRGVRLVDRLRAGVACGDLAERAGATARRIGGHGRSRAVVDDTRLHLGPYRRGHAGGLRLALGRRSGAGLCAVGLKRV